MVLDSERVTNALIEVRWYVWPDVTWKQLGQVESSTVFLRTNFCVNEHVSEKKTPATFWYDTKLVVKGKGILQVYAPNSGLEIIG